MNVLEAIKGRRSVRKYLPREVEEEKLRELLEAARWAPSWANTQCWEFILVKDPSTKEKLSETLPPGNPAREAVRTAPVVVVACGRTGVSGFYKGKAVTDKGDFYLFDVALALQNLCLAAHALGLGTVHVGYFDSQAAERLLGVPEGVKVVELVPVGYPAEEPRAPRRKELSEIVHRERYGQRG